MMRRWKKKLRYAYVRLLRSPGAPREVAGGMALGAFIAFLPIMGAQMVIAVAVAEVFRRLFRLRLSRVAAAFAVWLNNPLTIAPIYGGAFVVGRPFARLLLPGSALSAPAQALHLSDLAASGPFALEAAVSLIVGGVLLGIPAAVLGYKFTLRAVLRYQDRRALRRARLTSLSGAET